MAALWYAVIARFTACQPTLAHIIIHTYVHAAGCRCGFSTVPSFACNTLDIHHSSFASCHTSCSYFAAHKFRFSLSLWYMLCCCCMVLLLLLLGACICIYSCCCFCWGAAKVCLSFEIQIFRQLLVPTTAILIVVSVALDGSRRGPNTRAALI